MTRTVRKLIDTDATRAKAECGRKLYIQMGLITGKSWVEEDGTGRFWRIIEEK
jgi:hypothetical protein